MLNRSYIIVVSIVVEVVYYATTGEFATDEPTCYYSPLKMRCCNITEPVIINNKDTA